MSPSITSTSDTHKPATQEEDRKDVVETFNPRSPKFITVMLGMYMSVFLVALVVNTAFPNPQAPS